MNWFEGSGPSALPEVKLNGDKGIAASKWVSFHWAPLPRSSFQKPVFLRCNTSNAASEDQ
jgi:hypothetical protein